MRAKTLLKLTFVVAALLLQTTAAFAQDYKYSAGWTAGAIQFGNWNEGNASGTSIAPSSGWVVGLQTDHWAWLGQRVGLRFNGAFTKRPIELPADRARNLGITLADVDALIRLVPAGGGHRFSPYLGLGAGFVYYGLGSGETLQFPTANAEYRGHNRIRPAAVGTVGVEFLSGFQIDDDPVGFRVEVTDHIAKSPFEPLTGKTFDPVHNMRLVIGMFAAVGSY